MKRRVSLIVCSLLVGWSIATATIQNPELVTDRWFTKAVQKLSKDEVLSPPCFCPTSRPMTRYEAAVYAHVAYQELKTKVEKTKSFLSGFSESTKRYRDRIASPQKLTMPTELSMLKTWREDTELVMRLSKEFAYEIASLDVDTAAMNLGLKDLVRQFDELQAQAVLAVAEASSLGPKEDSHPSYRLIKLLRFDGLGRDIGLGMPSPYSRLFLAEEISLACDKLVKFSKYAVDGIAELKQMTKHGPTDADRPRAKELLDDCTGVIEWIERWSPRLRQLEKTIDFFELELKAMGKDPIEMKRQLRAALDERLK